MHYKRICFLTGEPKDEAHFRAEKTSEEMPNWFCILLTLLTLDCASCCYFRANVCTPVLPLAVPPGEVTETDFDPGSQGPRLRLDRSPRQP